MRSSADGDLPEESWDFLYSASWEVPDSADVSSLCMLAVRGYTTPSDADLETSETRQTIKYGWLEAPAFGDYILVEGATTAGNSNAAHEHTCDVTWDGGSDGGASRRCYSVPFLPEYEYDENTVELFYGTYWLVPDLGPVKLQFANQGQPDTWILESAER